MWPGTAAPGPLPRRAGPRPCKTVDEYKTELYRTPGVAGEEGARPRRLHMQLNGRLPLSCPAPPCLILAHPGRFLPVLADLGFTPSLWEHVRDGAFHVHKTGALCHDAQAGDAGRLTSAMLWNAASSATRSVATEIAESWVNRLDKADGRMRERLGGESGMAAPTFPYTRASDRDRHDVDFSGTGVKPLRRSDCLGLLEATYRIQRGMCHECGRQLNFDDPASPLYAHMDSLHATGSGLSYMDPHPLTRLMLAGAVDLDANLQEIASTGWSYLLACAMRQ
jgi:hypothetical protein